MADIDAGGRVQAPHGTGDLSRVAPNRRHRVRVGRRRRPDRLVGLGAGEGRRNDRPVGRRRRRPARRPTTPVALHPPGLLCLETSVRDVYFFSRIPFCLVWRGGGNLNKSLLKTMNEFEFYMESQSAALGLRCRRLLDLFIAHFNYFSLCSPFTRFLSWNCGLSLVWSWGYF